MISTVQLVKWEADLLFGMRGRAHAEVPWPCSWQTQSRGSGSPVRVSQLSSTPQLQ